MLLADAPGHKPCMLFILEPACNVGVTSRRDTCQIFEGSKDDGDTTISTADYPEKVEPIARHKILLIKNKYALIRCTSLSWIVVEAGVPIAKIPGGLSAFDTNLGGDGTQVHTCDTRAKRYWCDKKTTLVRQSFTDRVATGWQFFLKRTFLVEVSAVCMLAAATKSMATGMIVHATTFLSVDLSIPFPSGC